MTEVRAHYNMIAASYDALDITADKRDLAILKLVEVDKSTRVLDVAGGTSRFGVKVVNKVAIYVNVDFSIKMLAVAKERLSRKENCHLILGDIRALPICGNVFDLAICSEVLEHTSEQAVVLEETRRTLKTSGRIVITNPNPVWAIIEFLAEKLKLKPPEGPHEYISPWQLRRVVSNCGLVLIDSSYMFTPTSTGCKLGKIDWLLEAFALKQIYVCKKL